MMARPTTTLAVLAVFLAFPGPATTEAKPLLPIPDKLVVLTFDDGNKSDFTFVAPLLKRYGFGATFYITDRFRFDNKTAFLTWEEIKALSDIGFEIGNHTRSHPNMATLSREQIAAEVAHIETRCKEQGIPAPATFCYPGYHYSPEVLKVLGEKGYLFARRGVAPEFPYSDSGNRGPAYDPLADDPLLVPTTGASGPAWSWEDFRWAIEQAKDGKICVLTFHGVPATLHPWVSTKPDDFARYMKHLHDNAYTVIAMRDLAKYVDPARRAADPYQAIFNRLSVKPVQLKCEYTVNPVGIDAAKPRFSWLLESTRRAQTQAAYQILVASSEEDLKQGIGNLWDSGKVVSSESVNIPYEGPALTSGQKCWWKVRCWNEPGYGGGYAGVPNHDLRTVQAMREQRPGTYSAPATFEMGLLKPGDWQGKWIGAGSEVSSPLLRKAFTLNTQVKRATVHVCGLGYYELYLNGKKVGDHVLDPGTTHYHNDQPMELGSRVLYVTYDVTDQLMAGANALAVMLGHGLYSAEKDVQPSPSGREPYGDRPRVILQMNVELADGSRFSVATDPTWKASSGPTTYNDYCHGETYDARLEKSGFSTPGYSDSDWAPASELPRPSGRMVAQMLPPIRVMETLKPVRLLHPKEGVCVYDFGQNFSGWTRLRVRGPKGATVTIRHGACVYEDGSLDARSNLYSLDCTHIARQTETYILKGEGEEVWEPRFTMHGFRYAEVTGLPGPPTLENLEGRHARSSVETIGRFVCSNDLINRIHRAACWTLMSSMQSYPQDAADRSERVGWLGDSIPEDYMLNYDTAAYWAKWAADLSDAQKPDGDLPIICPLHWRRSWNGYGAGWTEWKSTYPIVVWSIYEHYGDRRILREHYDGMKRLVSFLGKTANGHVIEAGRGDHMEPQPDGTVSSRSKHTPDSLTATAYYCLDARIVARAAEILGQRRDAGHYAELASQIKSAFNRKFLDESTSQYATGSQTANAIPLSFNMVPEERIAAVVGNLVADVTARHHGHLSTGMLGTDALAQALPKYGRADVMYTIATQTTFPSWGYMLSKGATTLWESWQDDPKQQLSLNMKVYSSVDKFFYKDLAGIRADAPGYERIAIKPQVVGDLKSAAASLQTVRGLVAVDWKRGDKSLELNTTLPVNSRATVSIPTMGLEKVTIIESAQPVWKNGSYVAGVPGITGGNAIGDHVIFDVGSGSYRFMLAGTPKLPAATEADTRLQSDGRKGISPE